MRLQEARAKTREEARARLSAHNKAMKGEGESPYFKKEVKKDEKGGVKPTHGDGTPRKPSDPWKTHPADAKAQIRGYQKGGNVGEFPESPTDKKINARIEKYRQSKKK